MKTVKYFLWILRTKHVHFLISNLVPTYRSNNFLVTFSLDAVTTSQHYILYGTQVGQTCSLNLYHKMATLSAETQNDVHLKVNVNSFIYNCSFSEVLEPSKTVSPSTTLDQKYTYRIAL